MAPSRIQRLGGKSAEPRSIGIESHSYMKNSHPIQEVAATKRIFPLSALALLVELTKRLFEGPLKESTIKSFSVYETP